MFPLLATLALLSQGSFTYASADHGGIEMPEVTTRNLVPHRFVELGSQRVRTGYGVHTVKPRSEDNGMSSFRAALPAPCTDCLVTSMHAELQYTDGTVADADTGMWLHHTVFVNRNRNDSICPEQVRAGQRFFASGNERTEIDLTAKGRSKTAYPFFANDTLFMTAELMNMLDEPQEVILAMIWEFIPSLDSSFRQAVPYWLDIGGCGTSDKPAEANAQFTYSSSIINSSFHGQIVFIGGHLHDGGTHLDVLKDGYAICTTKASYSGAATSKDATPHIASISPCVDKGAVTPGDQWSIIAHYDTVEHPPMTANDGSLEPVMGIAIAYVVHGEATMPGGSTLLYIILPIVMAISLAAAYVVTQKRHELQQLWDNVRRRGWQRVQGSDAEADEREDEEGLPLAKHTDGSE